MDENEIHQWMIECFGPVQGEMAWQQFAQLPEQVRSQMAAQNGGRLPDPGEVRAMMQAFTAGGLNTPGEMKQSAEQGPINVKLARTIALGRVQGAESQGTITAADGQRVAQAMSQANLWLDAVCDFDPAPGQAQALTRATWVEGTLDSWARFAAPVARSMNNALVQVLGDRLGDLPEGGVAGMFAGPVPIPMPDGLKDPKTLIGLLGSTSFAIQLGQAAGQMAGEVHGSFDQGIALLPNPAGGLITQNIKEYATSLEFDEEEVMDFLALQEAAHARLYAAVPWLMPRFEALTGKYARGVDIDLEAMQDQIEQATSLDPESMAGAINLGKVGMQDTPEQEEAMRGVETLLALVDGWVDCLVWRAGMAHIPHLEQLREMLRRQRAVGGPAEQTFQTLIGLNFRPKRLREAAQVWEDITSASGAAAREAMWAHPDLLPALPGDGDQDAATPPRTDTEGGSPSGISPSTGPEAKGRTGGGRKDGIDWDAELAKLLDSGDDSTDGTGEGPHTDHGPDTDEDSDGDGNGHQGPAKGEGPGSR
ncbi:zinc-dependent metalloprotease [Bifidobacterium xylocopae]|uniref:Hydrolase n=1 Tax=Bifidobacterium xylocopae TaxID=2493119 RepID=A0A366KBG3_9BIFI|nr:zinc-dependent metalloprotease [Bifidobacterium xylocopae]RBP99065.1 hydrolase [Bifidobacterium xylocopae]